MRKRLGAALLALAFGLASAGLYLAGTQSANAAVVAFPGAEGFGTDTTGGRGGVVCAVTNLADSGTGSLRSCVERSGPRYVIFKTGGTILLNSRIDVDDPFITIAGQTAPGGGVTLRMNPSSGEDAGPMKISTHDVVIRYMRFRPGDGGAADDSHDGISAYQEGGGSYNVVIDHSSISWAVDENANVYYDVDDYTISNSIISEALSNAGHPDGEHSKGMLIGGGSTDGSLHGNLFVSNVDRNPQISGVQVADVRNNVMYNYGDGSGNGTTLVSSSKGEPIVNWVGNYYKKGPSSPSNYPDFALYDGDTGCTHQWHGSGNLHEEGGTVTAARVDLDDCPTRTNSPTPFAAAPVTTTSAQQAYTDVLADAGASRVRDEVDVRLVNEVKTGGGSFKNAGGPWPTLATGTPPLDSDNDGMPNSFEVEHGTNSSVPDANGDANGNGYTNVEDWANGLVGTVPEEPEPTPSPTPTVTPTPTPTQTTTPTPTPTPTSTPTPPQPTATVTVTVTPSPTQTCYNHSHHHRVNGSWRLYERVPHGCGN